MTLSIAVMLAAFVGVAFKAFQQLNVMHDKKLWVVPVSFGMAASEVFIIAQIAITQNYYLIFPLGLGAGAGCIFSMTLHKYLRKERPDVESNSRVP